MSDATSGVLRRVVRAVTAPVRGYFNGQFEYVKDEVRAIPASLRSDDGVEAWERLAELENLLAEQSVHTARTLAQMSDAIATCADRVADLERVVRQLALVVAPAEAEPSSPET